MAPAWSGNPSAPPAAINSRLIMSAIRHSPKGRIYNEEYSSIVRKPNPAGRGPLVDGGSILLESELYDWYHSPTEVCRRRSSPGSLGDHRGVEPRHDHRVRVAFRPGGSPGNAGVHPDLPSLHH